MSARKHLPAITGFFTAALILSNLLGVKIFTVFDVSFTASVLLYPITFMFGDILTEVYGYAALRRVVWTGFFSLVATMIFFEVVKALPPASFWNNQQAFETLLSQTPRIIIGSMISYFSGGFLNAYVLARMKIKSQGKHMWKRFVASTLAGEFVDTTLFCLIAFFGTMPNQSMVFLILSAWAAKVTWEILVLPLSMSLAQWLKRVENEDSFDTKTNFNPFVLQD